MVTLDVLEHVLRNALEKELASQKRLKNTTKQPQFIPIIEKDIAELQKALGSIKVHTTDAKAIIK